jgi:hypothetical protein
MTKIKSNISILYFGNRNFWQINKFGHTRLEQIYKTLLKNYKNVSTNYIKLYSILSFFKHLPYIIKYLPNLKLCLGKKYLILIINMKNKDRIILFYSNDKKTFENNFDKIKIETDLNEYDKKIIFFQNPLLWGKIKNINGYEFHFDSLELWLFQSEFFNLKQKIINNYKEIAYHVKYLTVHSKVSYDYFKKINSNVFIKIIKNGVDLDDFKSNKSIKLPFENDNFIIGIVGIFSENYDYPLLIKLVNKFPKISWVFIGRFHLVHLNRKKIVQQKDKLFQMDNVHLVPYGSLKKISPFIKKFNIGLVPYSTEETDNDYWKSRDVLKKYQYWACGIDVLSSKIDDVEKGYEKYIYYYNDYDDVVNYIETSLKKNQNIKLPKKLLENLSWKSRVRSLIELYVVNEKS